MLKIAPNRTGQTLRSAILGLAVLGISAGFAPGRLHAQPGLNVPFLQSYTGSLANGVGLPTGVMSNPAPFTLNGGGFNGGGFNGRVLGANPFASANLGVTSGGLASGYYFDLLSDQIALRRLLPQTPGISLGNSALRDFYFNPLSPFVSGWIPGPGTSPLEERLARIQRGELVAPGSPTESQTDSPADSTESADVRRVAKVMVLPAPAAEVEISEAVLELDSVPDTDAKVTATFPPPPRGFAARGLPPRTIESVEPFSALRFAMRDWSTTPFMPLRPGLYGVARAGDEHDYRGVPDEFAVPSNPVNGPAAFAPPLVLAARPKPLPTSSHAGEADVAVSAAPKVVATDSIAAVAQPSAVPTSEVASVSPPVAVVASAIASVASPKAPSAASQLAPLFDPAAIHQLASSSDALELALAGVRAEPAEPFAPAESKPTVANPASSSTLASSASPAPNSASLEKPLPTAVARRLPNAAAVPTGPTIPRRVIGGAPSMADVASTNVGRPSNAQLTDRSKFDFEGSTAAIDGMLRASDNFRTPATVPPTTVTPTTPPSEVASSRPAVRETPVTTSSPAAATIASRTAPRSPAKNSAPLASSKPERNPAMERTVEQDPAPLDRGLLAAIFGSPTSRAPRTAPSATAATTRSSAARPATVAAAATVASRTPPVTPSASSMAAAATRKTLPSTASTAAGNSQVGRASGTQATTGLVASPSPTYANNPSRGVATNGSSTYRSPAYGAVAYNSPVYGGVVYGQPGYGGVVYASPSSPGQAYPSQAYGSVIYASPTTDRTTERRSPPSTSRSSSVSSRPSTGASSGSMSSVYAAKPSKSFSQWRYEQLTEANRLIAEGERARLNGKSNTARIYFQQAQRIRDTVAALP